jgi:hypothetical protein
MVSLLMDQQLFAVNTAVTRYQLCALASASKPLQLVLHWLYTSPARPSDRPAQRQCDREILLGCSCCCSAAVGGTSCTTVSQLWWEPG